MAVAPPTYTTTPAFTPARGGLLSVATIVDDPNLHWQNGITYDTYPVPSAPAQTSIDCAPLNQAFDQDQMTTVTDLPVRVWTGHNLKLPGRTQDEIAAFARNRLTAGESQALESALWPKIVTTATTEGPATATPAGTSPVSLPAGVGALEKWLWTTYGGQGVIHAARQTVGYLAKADLADVSSSGLVTPLGTAISAGNYPGNAPAGTAPAAGTVWLAATAAVTIRRTQIRVRETFNPTTNEAQVIAERTYVVSWQKRHAAVPVTLEEE